MKVSLTDCTLRDGMHAIAHQYELEDVRRIAAALDAGGVDVIEVTHGDGLAGDSVNYGFALHDDETYVRTAREVIERARLAALLLPGIGTKRDIRRARDWGVDTLRVATHCTEADVARQHVEYARELGLDAVGFLMMAHMSEPDALAEQAALMASYGAHCVYVTDSAGALLMSEARARVEALVEAIGPEVEVGFHNHNNLGLGVANSIVAIEAGAARVDASLAGMGAGAGNCPLEVLVAVLDRMGIESGAALGPLLDAADRLARPLQSGRPVVTDANAVMLGYAGVYSSFLLHTERAARAHGVDARAGARRARPPRHGRRSGGHDRRRRARDEAARRGVEDAAAQKRTQTPSSSERAPPGTLRQRRPPEQSAFRLAGRHWRTHVPPPGPSGTQTTPSSPHAWSGVAQRRPSEPAPSRTQTPMLSSIARQEAPGSQSDAAPKRKGRHERRQTGSGPSGTQSAPSEHAEKPRSGMHPWPRPGAKGSEGRQTPPLEESV